MDYPEHERPQGMTPAAARAGSMFQGRPAAPQPTLEQQLPLDQLDVAIPT